jgi:hypothetical protein
MAPHAIFDIPAFPDAYNGVPSRLKEAAATRKKEYLGLRTKKASETRGEEVPVLPPGIARQEFDLALEELKQKIGDSNVVLNDKPLDDGWYEETSLLPGWGEMAF